MDVIPIEGAGDATGLKTKEAKQGHWHDLLLKLNELISNLGSDPKINIDIFVRYAAEIIGGACAIYNRLDEEGVVLYAYSAYNFQSGAGDKPDGHICYEETIKGQNVLIIFEDLEGTQYFETDPNVKKYGLKSYIGFPVSFSGKAKGALCVIDTKRREFSYTDREVITALAKLLSIEEERMRLNEAEQKRAACEKMIADISSNGLEVIDIEAFLNKCVQIMGSTIDVGGVLFWRYNHDSDTYSCTSEWLGRGIESHMGELHDIPSSALPLAADLFVDKGFNYQDIRDIPEGRKRVIMDMLGIKSVLSVTILVNKAIYGFLGFEEHQKYRQWSDTDITILKTVSQIIARTIENKLAGDEIKDHHDLLEREVKRRTADLFKTNLKLEEEIQERQKAENSLKSVLKLVEKERIEVDKKVLFNIRQTVEPYLKKIKGDGLNANQEANLRIAELNLKDIVSTLGYRLSSFRVKLTPMEIQVANLIEKNKNTKEISKLLNLSGRTIERHRYQIRKKLGIKQRNVSLRTFLLSFQ